MVGTDNDNHGRCLVMDTTQRRGETACCFRARRASAGRNMSVLRPLIESAWMGWWVLIAINLLLAWICIHRSNPHETETSVAEQDQCSGVILATVS